MSDPNILNVQKDVADSGVVTAAGTLTVSLRPPNSATWEVTQVTTEMPTAPAGALCTMRKNGNKITDLIATGDAAGGDPSVVLRQTDTLTVEWTQCTPGDVGQVFAFYNQYRRR